MVSELCAMTQFAVLFAAALHGSRDAALYEALHRLRLRG